MPQPVLAEMTISGVDYPLQQITVRRSVGVATMNFKIVGWHLFAIGAACTFTVAGLDNIHAVIISSDTTGRATTISADITPTTGSAVYDPGRIQYKRPGVIRGDLCFATKPGDTYAGRVIQSVTSTLGMASPWFNEVHF